MNTATLQLSPPAYLNVQSPDGEKSAKFDVYEARRMLEDAGRSPTEDARENTILKYLAGKLDVPQESMAKSTALEFNDAIVALVKRLNEERQKKTLQMLSSLTFTQESPATIASGQ